MSDQIEREIERLEAERARRVERLGGDDTVRRLRDARKALEEVAELETARPLTMDDLRAMTVEEVRDRLDEVDALLAEQK